MTKLLLRAILAAALGLGLALVPVQAPLQAYAGDRIEAAVKSAARSDRDLRAFYKARDYRPLWIRGRSLGPEADRLVALVANADLDGIDPGRYRPQALMEAVGKARSGSPKALAKAEALLSRTFITYVQDTRQPRDTAMVYIDRELAPGRPPARAVLEAAASARSLHAYLDDMQWMNPIYTRLRDGLAAYRHRGDAVPHFQIPPGPLLKRGAAGERVRVLRQRLGLPDGAGFDASVAAAVSDFQAGRGLPADGVAGPRTLAALNAGTEDQEQLLRLNLERARALPPGSGGRYVLVDAASAQLSLYEDGQVVDSMKVIVGKPSQQTPMLAAYIRYAMLNPYWHVPPDLVQTQIAPNVLAKGSSYLRAMRYEVVSDWTDHARVVDPAGIDWKAVAAGRIELPVRQLPGKGNAMGKMKFMLPNDLGIYLHDTPERALFQQAGRRFSSGCVRVEDAARLARWLFGAEPKTRSAAAEQRVLLPEPVPVYITYLTAAPTARGIAFRDDPYGRDHVQLARASGGPSAASR